MSERAESSSTTQETSSVMPGEEAMKAGIEMESMPDDSSEGTVVDALPGEDPTAVGNDEMNGFDISGMTSSLASPSFGMGAMEAPGLDGMPGEDGMGANITDVMPGEELTARESGKSDTEISGTFRLTLMPD